MLIAPGAMRQKFASPLRAATPRAVFGSVRANADATAMMRTLNAAFDEFKEKHEQRYSEIEASLDQMAVRDASDRLNGGATNSILPVDTNYTKSFASYTRRGDMEAEASLKTANASGERASIQAAMSEGDNSSGGYLAPVEWDRNIQKAQRALSPMRRISQVVTTGRAAYSTLWSNDQWGSGWVGETAGRPNTSTAGLAPLVIPAGEIYANPAVTQRLLDDSAVSLDQWLATNLSDEFSRQEGIAFISGDGVNKPMGLLQYVVGGVGATAHPGGTLDVVASGAASALTVDGLIDFMYGLGAPYRQNATWLMSSTTAAAIAKMKDGQGNLIWRESFIVGQPATLLGRPVEIDENMPSIVAGNTPIAFGDFQRGYLVNDRIGVRILRDPYTMKPYVSFYATKRVGAGLLDPHAIRLLKVGANA